MKQLSARFQLLIVLTTIILLNGVYCKKDKEKCPETPDKSPKADFSFVIKNQGDLHDTVSFSSNVTNATSLNWSFDNGTVSTEANPKTVYVNAGTYNVKLVATNQFGSDSITKQVLITLNRPVANFTYSLSNTEIFPVVLTTSNTTTGSNATYRWSFGNSTSNQVNPVTNFTSGGIYIIKLVATNSGGSDSVTKELRISPYPQMYKTFNGVQTNLNSWEGNHVMILSRNGNLNRTTMFKWLKAMDTTFGYYKLCTDREPIAFTPYYYINNRATIADVASTCGAGCGYLGWTGIELQNTYFDLMYNSISNNNQYDQAVFYEFGRNFWFYGDQLAYKTNDPVTTGFAVFMRFMAINAAGVNGAPFGSLSFNDFQNSVINLVDQYLANPSLTWNNTLGAGQGVPGGFGGGADLFASFCFRLKRDYGGESFVQNLWKKAGIRPNAATTQEAVDNFFLASCGAANKNLTTVFQSWRWPLSSNATTVASQYP